MRNSAYPLCITTLVVAAFGGFFPIFGFSVDFVRGNYTALELYGFYVKIIVVRIFYRKPDVFHAVFPVAFCTPAFFPLPGNPV